MWFYPIWGCSGFCRIYSLYPPASLMVERERLQLKSQIPIKASKNPGLSSIKAFKNPGLQCSNAQISQFAFQACTFSCFKAFQNSFPGGKSSGTLSPKASGSKRLSPKYKRLCQKYKSLSPKYKSISLNYKSLLPHCS